MDYNDYLMVMAAEYICDTIAILWDDLLLLLMVVIIGMIFIFMFVPKQKRY